jgi:hypothetical protein
MARKPLPVVDQPEPGYWKTQFWSGGWHEVPVAIVREDGEWRACVDGDWTEPHPDPVHAKYVLDIWHKRKTPISSEEFDYLCGELKAWAQENYPEHPLLHPQDKVVKALLRPTPAHRPPESPVALVEPHVLNKPTPPRPINPAQIIEFLNYENEALVEMIHRDVATLAEDAEVVITDPMVLRRIGANMDIAKTHARQAEKLRKEQKDPFLEGGRTVDKWFNRAMAALERAMMPVQQAMNAYARREDELRREEARKAAEAAAAEAQRQAEAVAAQLKRNPLNPAVDGMLDDATEAAKEAEKAAALATGKAADLVRETTDYGAVVSARESWSGAVTDPSKVPLEYWQINQSLLDAHIRLFAKDKPAAARDNARDGTSPIPGVKIIRTVTMR